MLGDNIKYLRLSKELTQEDLGKILNKTKNNISQYETGKREPDADTLKKIARYFNVSIDYLLDVDLLATHDQPLSLSQKIAIKLADELKKDGYELKENDFDNLILAAKITLEQNKKKNND